MKTGGYQAEYGRNTGGVINVITKSGGNEFHGGVFGYYNDTGMRADQENGEVEKFATPNFSQTGDAYFLNNIFEKDVRQEWGADLGGFFLKDKIWFFGAYDRVQVNRNLEMLDLDNDSTFGQLFPQAFTQNKYSGKLTFNLFQGTSIIGSVFSDAQTQIGAIAFPTSSSPFQYNGRRDTGGPDYAARLNQLFGSFGIFTFQYSQHKDRYNTKPSAWMFLASATTPRIPTACFSSGPRTAASAASSAPRSTTPRSVRGSPVRSRPTWATTRSRSAATTRKTPRAARRTSRAAIASASAPVSRRGASQCDLGAAPLHESNGETLQVFYQHDLLANGTTDNYEIIDASPFNTPTKRYAGFIQDQWRIIPTLTMNLGVRYDSEQFFGFSRPGHRRIQGLRADQSVGAARRPRVGLGGGRHLEAVRFGRPFLLLSPDRPQRSRVHGQLGGPDL